MAELHSRWGFWMMHHRLRALNYTWNHKRVYRVYTEMGLNLRRKHKKRLPQRIQEPLLQPLQPNITWSMDFVHDGLLNGIKFRSFNIIDDFNREALNITLDTSITSKRVIRQLEQLIAWRGKPEQLRVDNGPEFIAEAMETWAKSKEIDLKFIQKGKPHQNGYVERFNRSYREEVLDVFSFNRLKEAQLLSNAWVWMYNNERPHSSLGYKTPVAFMQERLRGYASPTFLHEKEFSWNILLKSATN
jgi:putative transposase